MKEKAYLKLLPLLALVFLLAGCGTLPIKIDLLPTLKNYGYDQGSFSKTFEAQSGATLTEDLEFRLPDDTGYSFTFEVPELPATPASMALNYKINIGYQIECIEGLTGEIAAQVYLSGEPSKLWDSPLEGATTRIAIQDRGDLNLEGKTFLTQEQLEAVLNGSLVLGIELKTENLSGKVRDGCSQVEISGQYSIKQAIIEIRFL